MMWFWLVAAAFAADVAPEDGCEDSYAVNGSCVQVGASIGSNTTIGANSVVAATASIGANVQFGPPVNAGPGPSIFERSSIGSGTDPGSPATVGAGTVLGRRVLLGADAHVGDDVVFARTVTAGDRLDVLDEATIGYGTSLGDDVSVGAGATIGATVQVGDYNSVGNAAVVARGVTIAGSTSGAPGSIDGIVGPGVAIGSGVTIEAGVRIRKEAVLQDGARVLGTARIGRDALIEAGATVQDGAVVRANAVVQAGTTVPSGMLIRRGVVFSGTEDPELCANGIDDDGDGQLDCDDTECTDDAACLECSVYSNGALGTYTPQGTDEYTNAQLACESVHGVGNCCTDGCGTCNNKGFHECGTPNCNGSTYWNFDSDDQAMTCGWVDPNEIIISLDGVTWIQTPEVCSNGVDDDADGLSDAEDPDCGAPSACEQDDVSNGLGGTYEPNGLDEFVNAERACESVFGVGNCCNDGCGSCDDRGFHQCGAPNCNGSTYWNYDNDDQAMQCGWVDPEEVLISLDGFTWIQGPEVCDNGSDDDGDGQQDCDDSDCDTDPACQLASAANGLGGLYTPGGSTEFVNAERACESVFGVGNCCNDGCGTCNDRGFHQCGAPNCNGSTYWNYDNDDQAMQCGWVDPEEVLISLDGFNWIQGPEACDNGADDDGDGLADCADSDCDSDPGCQVGTVANGLGGLYSPGGSDEFVNAERACESVFGVGNCCNDGCGSCDDRGFHQCGAPNCNGSTYWNYDNDDQAMQCGWVDPEEVLISLDGFTWIQGPEVCDNNSDDDGDGQQDCADSDCDTDPACQVASATNGLGGLYAPSGSNEFVNAERACESVFGAGNCCNDGCGSCNDRGFHQCGAPNCNGSTYWNYDNDDQAMQCGWVDPNEIIISIDGVNWVQ